MAMTTYDSRTPSATGAQRPAGRLGVRLAELDRSKSSVCQQNRLHALLQVRLGQLEHDRRTALARITHAQRQFEHRYANTHDRISIPRIRLNTSCLDDEQEHDDGQTSKCPCDCCRYGLWSGKNRPADVLQSDRSTIPARFGRPDTVCPVVKPHTSRVIARTIGGRYCDDATKRYTGTIFRSQTTI